MDSLLINDGIVNMSGFDYGFIGGATFKLNSHQIALTGMIESSSEKNAIEKEQRDKGKEVKKTNGISKISRISI